MELTNYCEIFNINNKKFLFNTNNGSLIVLDLESYKKIILFKKNKDIAIFSEDEIAVLIDQEFLVESNFDEEIKNKNKLTYNISKYSSEKESVKIDFAITNLCNFCCPYCFERENLNKKERCSSNLIKTSEYLYQYIDKVTLDYVKDLKIVYYGGEPTLEKNFIIKFNEKVKNLCVEKNIKFHFNIISNGYLIDEDFVKHLQFEDCDFIQITIDGEKEFHNSRRTNKCKINTFDKIIYNINKCAENKIKIVIRLNVDKQNYQSIKQFLEKIANLLGEKYFGQYIFVDIARVFGSINSFNLFEYEKYREELFDICYKQKLVNANLMVSNLNTFCIAESLTKDIVLDSNGNLYRCWNNVFDENFKIGTIQERLNNNCDPYDNSDITLDFVENMSLMNVNNSKCFSCKYIKYCQGLCHSIRKNIIENIDQNIYKNNECKKIIKKRIQQLISKLEV